MKIGCLQFAPKVGDIDNNLNRADAVLNKSLDLEDLDILVLPELAFTGYKFNSLAHISPYLEPAGSGISALWARTTALKLNCNVVVGYPEKVDVTENWPTSPEFYNSAILVNRDGETIANYRKSFLYATDETWALEGRDGFFDCEIDDLGNVAMGICMDINPYKFEARWDAFEFAYHVIDSHANVVILTMAWVTREDPRSFTQLAQEPDLNTLHYWLQRLEPAVRRESDEEIIFIVCNRTGVEEDSVYTGSSAVFGVKGGKVMLYGILGRGVKDVLIVDTSKKPIAKVARVQPGQEIEAGTSQSQPQYRQAAQTTDNSSNSAPSVSAYSVPTSFSSQEHTSRLGMPNGDNRSEWGNMYESWDGFPRASMEYQSLIVAMKAMPPTLGLQIPDIIKFPTTFRTGMSPLSDLEVDIITPTAPSPTDLLLRPRLALAEGHPGFSSTNDAAKATRQWVDSPMTPRSHNFNDRKLSTDLISWKPPYMPFEDVPVKKDAVDENNTPRTSSESVHVSNQTAEKWPEMQQTDAVDEAMEDNEIIELSEAEITWLSDEMKSLGTPQANNVRPPSPTGMPIRPPSTKSRNASCSRVEGTASRQVFTRSLSLSGTSIPLIASPSVFYREPLSAFLPPRDASPAQAVNTPGKAMAHVQRNSSATRNVPAAKASNTPEIQSRQASGRPISRGRQPLAKTNPTNGGTRLSSSANAVRMTAGSTDRGRQTSNNRSVLPNRTTSTASSVSWLFGTPPPHTQPNLDPDDEIVAMINLVNRSCPVHNHSHTPQGQTVQPQGHQDGNSTTVTPSNNGPLTQTPVVGGPEDSIYEIYLPPNIRELVESLSSPEARNRTPLRGRDMNRSRTSPRFDPPTPTAMHYDASLKDEAVILSVAPAGTKQEC